MTEIQLRHYIHLDKIADSDEKNLEKTKTYKLSKKMAKIQNLNFGLFQILSFLNKT